MEIDKNYLFPYLLHVSVGNDKRIVGVGVKREMSHKAHDTDIAERCFINIDTSARTLRRTVGGAQNFASLLEIGTQLGARPGVVAEGDNIRSGVENHIRLLRRNADNICVFAVDHDKVQLHFLAYPAQVFIQIIKARLAANIANCQNFYAHGFSFQNENL